MKRADRGQTLVEFALILPILLLMLIGIFDFGRAVFIYNAISNGAREGARYGIIHPTDVAEIEARAVAQTALIDLGDPNLTITVETPDGTGRGDPLTVTMQYDFYAVTPFLSIVWGGGSLPLEGSATMHIE